MGWRTQLRLESIAAQALALVPLVVGLVLGALMLPRSVPPEEVPAPVVDARALAGTIAADDARAARVEGGHALPSVVRAVGSALIDFDAAEAGHQDAPAISHAHDEIVSAIREIKDGDVEGLLDLRAVQMTRFLGEVRAYERTGKVSTELAGLGGTFIERMIKVGWCDHHRLDLPEVVRRVAFKLTWTRTLLLESDPRFALTLDETRELYRFYFGHAHPPEQDRARLEAGRALAHDALSCARAKEAEDKAIGAWLLAKIAELSRVDPTYPALLAKGAALFMKHDYAASANAYAAWLEAHPNGPWTLRAEYHYRAAILADREVI